MILCINPGLVDEILEYNQPFIIRKYESDAQLKRLIEILHEPENESGLVLFSADIQALKDAVFRQFVCIEAAGGVVQNDEKQVLLIFRRGSWDLPKGKVDEGESLEQAAVREVVEETGLTGTLQLLSKVYFQGWLNDATYHTYPYKGSIALKISHWYLMNYTGSDDLIPQMEEDIEQAVWVDPKELSQYFEPMYPSVIDVLKAVFPYS